MLTFFTFQITIEHSIIKTEAFGDVGKLFFHSTTGIKSLVLQNVTFTNVEKIVFEPFISVEETDDGVNFGKNVVRINLNSPKNGKIRALKNLEIGITTCLDNKACMIEHGNTTSCVDTNPPGPAEDGQNDVSTIEDGSTVTYDGNTSPATGDGTEFPTSKNPESSTSKACLQKIGHATVFLAIAHLLALM